MEIVVRNRKVFKRNKKGQLANISNCPLWIALKESKQINRIFENSILS
jgi:hypothetical protein